MYGLIGLLFDDRGLAEGSDLIKIVEHRKDIPEFFRKEQSQDMDYSFNLFKLFKLFSEDKKIGIFVGNDYNNLVQECVDRGYEGYAIILPSEKEIGFYIEPYFNGVEMVFKVYNLSQITPAKIRKGQVNGNIPSEGYGLCPGDVIIFDDKKVQFKKKREEGDFEKTAMFR